MGVVTKWLDYVLAGKAFFLPSKTFRFPLTAGTVSKEGIQYIYGYCFEELVKGVL